MAFSDSPTSHAQRVASFRAAWAADRSARWASFRRRWPMYVLGLLCEMGFGFLAGLALGLASLVFALPRLVELLP